MLKKTFTSTSCLAVDSDNDIDSDSNSYNDNDNFSVNDGSEPDLSLDEECDEELIVTVKPLTQSIEKDNDVLVAFKQKGVVQCLVGIAIDDEDSVGDINETFFRKSAKIDNTFV